MRLLADENFPKIAVEALRQDGHDVSWVRTDFAGAHDKEVLARSTVENRIIITFDKDFGELAFKSGIHQRWGVILFRIVPRSPQFVAEVVVKALRTRSDWAGHFSVVQESRVRMVPLPRPQH